jgi:type VI secretion system protein ImpM
MVKPVAMKTLLPQSVGWYGKLPSRGDFVGRGLPRPWLRSWDEWLQRAMAEAAPRFGPAWRDRVTAMPPWQCVVLPAHDSLPAWCGVVVASADRVGRAFPMLLAEAHDLATLDGVVLATLHARGRQLAGWLDDALRLASMREFESDVAGIAAAPWPCDADAAAGEGEALGDWRARWPSAASFWWRVSTDADVDEPLAEPWPPREALVLDWLGGTDTPVEHADPADPA